MMVRVDGSGEPPQGGWYFDDAGKLARSGSVSRLREWAGLAYAVIILVLGASSWLGRGDRPREAGHFEVP